MPLIKNITAREILDSRGRPTVEADVLLDDGARGRASVPSGASTGRHEAVELRDGDTGRMAGRGVRKAVANVGRIAGVLIGRDPLDQRSCDLAMSRLDGSGNKGNLGANAILSVSMAICRAAAAAGNVTLWKHIASLRTTSDISPGPLLPMPMVNIISGGLHAAKNLDFQDFLVIPVGAKSYSRALAMCLDIHAAAARVLTSRSLTTLKADEGGYGPQLASNREALSLLMKVVAEAGYKPGEEVAFALDVAATHFYDPATSTYRLASEDRGLNAREMVNLLDTWCDEFPIVSIEDGLAEDDWNGWRELTARLGNRIQVIGDDLFTTNSARLRRGIADRAANCVLVKMNQIGTITETLDVVAEARAAGFRTVISARSGETEDSFLADLAVGSQGAQIKVGSVFTSERMSKYNQLLRIEEEAGAEGRFAVWGGRNI